MTPTLAPAAQPTSPARTLAARVVAIAAIATVEIFGLSYLAQGSRGIVVHGAEEVVRELQHYLFRFLIAYAASLAMFAVLSGNSALRKALLEAVPARVRPVWGIAHLALLAPFAALSAILYHDHTSVPFAALAIAWHGLALASAASLFATFAPASVWLGALRAGKSLLRHAAIPAALAVAMIPVSQALWVPAAGVTFRMAAALLQPFYPLLIADPATRILGTERFAVSIAPVCSGLEGVGLMFAFCAGWLWIYRREYRFPRALWILPAGMVLVFLLNAVRIALLVVIGNAGAPRVAQIGFHSQAGWIAFNLSAFLVAVVSKRWRWLHRAPAAPAAPVTSVTSVTSAHDRAPADNPPAPYLMPLLAMLAAGMLSHAASAGFEWLYPIRPLAAAAILVAYRRHYRAIDWRLSGVAVATGIALFGVWALVATRWLHRAPMPEALAGAPATLRFAWLGARVAGTVLVTPLVGELAFRGYLMRRLAGSRFETVAYGSIGWLPVIVAAIAYGAMHGALWPAATVAGIAFGWLAIRGNRLADAIVAHVTLNALIVAAVLVTGQWQYW